MSYVTELMDDLRISVHADKTQLSDKQALRYLKKAYRYIINKIRSVNKDYYYDYWKAQSVIGQEEYTLMKRGMLVDGVPQPGMKKLKEIGIKYNSKDIDFTPVKIESLENVTQERDINWFKNNQPKSYPFGIIMDNSIFIYPAPTEMIEEAVIFYGISDPLDLALEDKEEQVRIPQEYHYMLVERAKPYYYAGCQDYNTAMLTTNEYKIEEVEMLKNLRMREVEPRQVQDPPLRAYY